MLSLTTSKAESRGDWAQLATIVSKAGLTWLCYHKFGLRAQVATPVNLALLLLALIVQHMVHLVVDHIVSELLAVGAHIFRVEH